MISGTVLSIERRDGKVYVTIQPSDGSDPVAIRVRWGLGSGNSI